MNPIHVHARSLTAVYVFRTTTHRSGLEPPSSPERQRGDSSNRHSGCVGQTLLASVLRVHTSVNARGELQFAVWSPQLRCKRWNSSGGSAPETFPPGIIGDAFTPEPITLFAFIPVHSRPVSPYATVTAGLK